MGVNLVLLHFKVKVFYIFSLAISVIQTVQNCDITKQKFNFFILCHSCLKVHGGVQIVLCISWDPLVLRINCLVLALEID